MHANLDPLSPVSWLSLIADISEADEAMPSQSSPCSGGLSCEIEPYRSLVVSLSAPAGSQPSELLRLDAGRIEAQLGTMGPRKVAVDVGLKHRNRSHHPSAPHYQSAPRAA